MPLLHLGLHGSNHRHANQSIGVSGRIAVEQIAKQIRGFRIDEGRSAERQLVRSFGRSRRRLINRNEDTITDVTDDFPIDRSRLTTGAVFHACPFAHCITKSAVVPAVNNHGISSGEQNGLIPEPS